MKKKRMAAGRGPRHRTLESFLPPVKPMRVSELSGRTLQVVTHILNSIWLEDYGSHCSIQCLAKALNSTPGLLRAPLRRLKEGGLITLEGDVSPTAYPTVKLFIELNPTSLPVAAQDTIRRLRHSKAVNEGGLAVCPAIE
jgi:DNA-binding transcriptional ArsR family regulator